MRKIVRLLLLKPILWAAEKFSSRPDRRRIFQALDTLYQNILEGKTKKGLLVPFDLKKAKFIIFSDQHKGAKNGADDFMHCETNYVAALEFYHRSGYHFISLGDSEELWENPIWNVMKKNPLSSKAEQRFIPSNAFIKIFGNHDLDWGNDPFAGLWLTRMYGSSVPVYEGVVLETVMNSRKLRILCAHGHQGDKQSDGNWFSKFFVAKIWAPMQAYLRINPNTPAYDAYLKTEHNRLMYEWVASKKDTLLITGHTHQPVFESLTHLERLLRRLQRARQKENREEMERIEEEISFRKYKSSDVIHDYSNQVPTYFNSGCCCFSDGDITGIEIVEGKIMLIKWKLAEGIPKREVLEDAELREFAGS